MVINRLLLFGVIYLFIPFILSNHVSEVPLKSISFLFLLAIFSTIGGFFCTTKALTYLSATKVQIIELMEPVIALILAFFILGQAMAWIQILGGFFIIISIICC